MRFGFGAAKAAVPAASSVGPSEGATGRPSLVAARSRSCAGMRPPGFGGGLLVLEEHARCARFELHGADQFAEGAYQVRALSRAERVHALDQPILRGRRRAPQQSGAARRELELDTPPVALARPALHQL